MVATTNGIASSEGPAPYQGHPNEVNFAVLFNGHYDKSDQLKNHIQDKDMYRFFGGYP